MRLCPGFVPMRVLVLRSRRATYGSSAMSSIGSQLRRLRPQVREHALQLLSDKRVDDAQVVDHQGGADVEAEKLLAGAQGVQLLAVAADEQKASEIAAIWLQVDRFKALDRALLLQLNKVLDSLVEDLQGFQFPTPHGRAPYDHKCASGHCASPFLYPRLGQRVPEKLCDLVWSASLLFQS